MVDLATTTPVAQGGRPVDDGARLRAEVRRIYATSSWVGPVGTSALSLIVVALLWREVARDRLVAWAALVGVGVIGQVVSIVVPRVRRWEASTGLPRLTFAAHAVVGTAYGLLLWLDPGITERAELRWFAVSAMFAMSAGVASGLNGLDRLGLCVLGPMWTLGPLALLAAGEWEIGVGGLVFLVIQLVDQRRSGELWRELVTLRIDQERRADQQRWIAQHDDLTGTLNRSGVLAALADAEGRVATVMYVDLDHFKEVNDRFGHAAGDEVLVEVARRLRSTVRDDDAVGRLGGDEFFVVFARPLSRARSAALGAQIIEEVELPIDTAVGVAKVSASVGAATMGIGRGDGRMLMQRADHALLRAKRRGRRRVEIADD